MFGAMDTITSDSVIDALGGTNEVAAALSLSPSSVSLWRDRADPNRPGGIPSGRWVALARLASEKGVAWITLDALAKIGEPEEVRA